MRKMCVDQIEWHISHGLPNEISQLSNLFVLTPLKRISTLRSSYASLHTLHQIHSNAPHGTSIFQTLSEDMYINSHSIRIKVSSNQSFTPKGGYCDICRKDLTKYRDHIEDPSHIEGITKSKYEFDMIEKAFKQHYNDSLCKGPPPKYKKIDVLPRRVLLLSS